MNRVARVIWTEVLPLSPVFSSAEVVARTRMALSNVSRDLAALAADGLVTRIRRGLWCVPSHPDFSPYAVVPRLCGAPHDGYVSLLSALNLHGMIDQIPRAVHVATRKQRPPLRTPVATYEFFKIQAELFGGAERYRRTGDFDIATPEKALFDTLYLAARKGRRFASLPEIELPPGFAASKVRHWIGLVHHGPLRIAVRERWDSLAHRAVVRA